MTALFVYGTLLSGEPEHGRLARAVLIREARTAPGWSLVDLGAYPALARGGQGRVEGELYEVDPALLDALDEYEGCPELFERSTVEVEGAGEVVAYLGAGCLRGRGRPIDSGSWRRRSG